MAKQNWLALLSFPCKLSIALTVVMYISAPHFLTAKEYIHLPKVHLNVLLSLDSLPGLFLPAEVVS